MKKIGILTLGLKDNYGGILQAIALYSFIKSNGYSPILIRKYRNENALKKLVRNLLQILPMQNVKGIRQQNLKYKKNIKFWSKYMEEQTPIFTKKNQVEKYVSENLDAVIVGSDQVWRYSYINDGEYDVYFLNFKSPAKKIAYAASFGTNQWEQPQYNNDIHTYMMDFSNISVREKSALDICKKSFNIDNASWVLDPTLLIGAPFFREMISNEVTESSDSISYILDNSVAKEKIINDINMKYNNKNNFNLLTKSSAMEIPEWVSKFNSTKVVITDSFHGMVFSILFEKEFFVILNKERGADRFYSLCEELDIMDRIIDSESDVVDFNKINTLDYNSINDRLKLLRDQSSKFLLKALM